MGEGPEHVILQMHLGAVYKISRPVRLVPSTRKAETSHFK